MNFLSGIKSLFSELYGKGEWAGIDLDAYDAEVEKNSKKTVARFARGNIAAQHGNIEFSKELSDKRK